MNSLSHHAQIKKGFSDWRLSLYFSKPVLHHLLHFVDGMSSIGFTGKLTQIHALSHHSKHRTTLSHFLHKSPWKEQYLNNSANSLSIESWIQNSLFSSYSMTRFLRK